MNHADAKNRRVRHRSSNETRPNDCSAHAKGSARTTMTTRFLRNGTGNHRLCQHDNSPQSEYTDSKAAGVVGNPSVKCSNNGDEGLSAGIVFSTASGPDLLGRGQESRGTPGPHQGRAQGGSGQSGRGQGLARAG